MTQKKTCLKSLIGQGIKIKSIDGCVYGTIFQESPNSKLEFIYRMNSKAIGSILLDEQKINYNISDNNLCIKNRYRMFCHGKLIPFICTFEDYQKRNNFLLSLEFPVGEDYSL